MAAEPVVLVIQRRVASESGPAYADWLARAGQIMAGRPGFLGQEIMMPNPPMQVDWVTVLRFASADDARSWLHSEERLRLLPELARLSTSAEDLHLLTDRVERARPTASAVISCHVEPSDVPDFLAWQRKIAAAEASFPGFRGHKLEAPVPGIHDDWALVLSFDSEDNLNRWIASPQRTGLLAEGARFNTDLRLRRTAYGFDFWAQPEGAARAPVPVMRSNLLVLLVLYPIVFLWGYFVSGPFIDSRGVPFWLSLFVGTLVSTQLLGWYVVPATFRLFGWWLEPGIAFGRTIAGYALLAILYALSMACYAWLLWLGSS